MEDTTQNNEQEQTAPNSLEQLSFKNSSLSKLAYMLPIILVLTIVTIIYHHSWKTIALGTLGYIVSLVLLMQLTDRFDHFVPRLFLFFLAVSPFGYAISISNYSQEIIYGSGGLYALLLLFWGFKTFRNHKNEYDPSLSILIPATFIFLLFVLLIGPIIAIGSQQNTLMAFTVLGFLFFTSFIFAKIFNSTVRKERLRAIIVYIYVLLYLVPFAYACTLVFHFLYFGILVLIFMIPLTRYLRQTTKAQVDSFSDMLNNWKKITLSFPEEVPNIAYNKVEFILREGEMETTECNVVVLEFPIQYTVKGKEAHLKDFTYKWIAPKDDPFKVFDYNTTYKGTTFELIYNPEDIESVYSPITEENFKQIQDTLLKKQDLYDKALLIAFLTLLGIIIGAWYYTTL